MIKFRDNKKRKINYSVPYTTNQFIRTSLYSKSKQDILAPRNTFVKRWKYISVDSQNDNSQQE